MNADILLARVVLILICILYSCSESHNELLILKLNHEQSIDQIDSFYLTDVWSIVSTGNEYFLSDNFETKIFCLNNKYNLIYFVGSKGKGPAELLSAEQFCVYKDTIFIMNSSNQSIEVYKDDRYVRTIKSDDFNFYGMTRFSYHNGIFYFPSHDIVHRVMTYNKVTDITTYFGKDEMKRQMDQFSHVLFNMNQIYVVSNSNPEILVYNIKGELIQKFEYSNIPIISDFMRFRNIYPKQPDGNSFIAIIQDAEFYNNELYILFLSLSEENHNVCRHILKLSESNDGRIYPHSILELDARFATTFAVDSTNIIIYDASNRVKSLRIYRNP